LPMLSKYFLYSLIVLSGILLFSACDEDKGGNPCQSDFDQVSLYANVADNIIIPGYNRLSSELFNLQLANDLFAQNPGLSQLINLRNAFVSAYTQWQWVAQFEFGPAEQQMLRSRFNNFPVNAQEVEAKVQLGDFSLNNPDTYDKGFPALDYLLYGIAETDNQILNLLSNPGQMGYQNYISAIIEDMEQRSLAVLKAWQEEGYRESFIENTGTAAGASLSLLINNLNAHYEIIKRDKIGIPSGVTTLGITFPEKVEGFYSGLSLSLAEEALKAAEGLYRGRNTQSGADGPGLDDYLQAVNATKEGQNLSSLIKNQFQKALEALAQAEPPLSTAIESNNEVVVNAYNEITRQLVNLKTDMPSVLCVSITYVDNASDSD
ncbi:MAG: imelysin family protein, partial [Phaeodactylibacter sp.]|nr:imelysin family protein [Phaeodactylibacter sp.]